MIAKYLHVNKLAHWHYFGDKVYAQSIKIHNCYYKNIIILRNFITPELIIFIQKYICPNQDNFINSNDSFSPNSCHYSNNAYLQMLLHLYLPFIEHILHKKLIPIYANCKIYKNNSILIPHTDFKYLEYTITINITKASQQNLIVCDTNDKYVFHVDLNIGDALLFKGTEVLHARCKYNGEPYLQLLLHYMSKDTMEKHNLYKYANYYTKLLE